MSSKKTSQNLSSLARSHLDPTDGDALGFQVDDEARDSAVAFCCGISPAVDGRVGALRSMGGPHLLTPYDEALTVWRGGGA